MIPAGATGSGGGGGAGVAIVCVSAVGPVVGVGGGGGGVGVGWVASASFSPVHSRNEPHDPQKLAPASFSKPHTLHVIKSAGSSPASSRRSIAEMSECNRPL
jgi:hypothetical protein